MSGKRVRLKDIAERAGVSPMAVSHVLTGAGAGRIRVGEEKRKLIEKTAKEMNYVPNLAARQLSAGRSKTFGILIDHTGLSSAPWRLLQVHLSYHAQKAGFQTITEYAGYNLQKAEKIINHFQAQQVEAVICLNLDRALKWAPPLEAYKKIKNFIFLGDANVPGEELVQLPVDFAKGAYDSTTYFIKKGCQKVGFFVENVEWLSNSQRFEGYKQALADNSIEFDKDLIHIGGEVSLPYNKQMVKVIDRLLENGVEAVVAHNDYSALALLTELDKRGLTLPVIGQDNSHFTQFTNPPISSVDYQIEDMAQKIIEFTVKTVENKPAELFNFQPELITK